MKLTCIPKLFTIITSVIEQTALNMMLPRTKYMNNFKKNSNFFIVRYSFHLDNF